MIISPFSSYLNVCVYKYFDIGTAKPSAKDRQIIPHHLIDILEPDEEFNAFDFKIRALKIINDLMSQNKIPILVGGTALYLKVLIQDYDCAVEISEETRKKIRQEILEQKVEKVVHTGDITQSKTIEAFAEIQMPLS